MKKKDKINRSRTNTGDDDHVVLSHAILDRIFEKEEEREKEQKE